MSISFLHNEIEKLSRKKFGGRYFFENLIFRGSLYEHLLPGSLIYNVGEVMEKVRFSLGKKVNFGSYGLVLVPQIHKVTQERITQKKYDELIF